MDQHGAALLTICWSASMLIMSSDTPAAFSPMLALNA
jgi:hypothetical protein